MKRNLESNLGYIMRILNISGKELARAIHVDVSLVSKWKTRKRKIIQDSQYFVLMLDMICSRSAETDHQIILKALSKFEYPLESDKEIREAIGDFILRENLSFLSNPLNIILPSDPTKTVYDYNFRVFKGNEGRRRAVIQFFDKLLSYEQPTTIRLFSQEDLLWLMEDPQYTRQWLQTLGDLLNRGHRIQMIHFVDREVNEISQAVLYWAMLYTMPNIESFYYERYLDTEITTSLFIEGNRLAVYGTQIENSGQSERYTGYYEDEYTVRMYRNLFDRYMERSSPLVLNYAPDQYCRILSGLEAAPDGRLLQYISPLPHLAMFTQDHLVEILERNGIEESAIERMIGFHAKFRGRMQAGLRGILSFDALLAACKAGGMEMPALSGCMLQPVRLNREDLWQILRDLRELNQRPNSEIVLVENGKELFESGLVFLIDQGRMVISYMPMNLRHFSVVTEATVVRSFDYYFMDLWNRIPRVSRTQEANQEKIDRLLEFFSEKNK